MYLNSDYFILLFHKIRNIQVLYFTLSVCRCHFTYIHYYIVGFNLVTICFETRFTMSDNPNFSKNHIRKYFILFLQCFYQGWQSKLMIAFCFLLFFNKIIYICFKQPKTRACSYRKTKLSSV